jgi:DNA mismatch repair protein MSH4
MVSDHRIADIEKSIAESLNEEAAPSKVSKLSLNVCLEYLSVISVLGRYSSCECSRLRGKGWFNTLATAHRLMLNQADRNRLLDVARETYKENITDIFQLHQKTREEHDLPLQLIYQESGYVYALKKNDLEGELPRGSINITVQKGKWIFSTLEMVGIGWLPDLDIKGLMNPFRKR